MTEPPAGSPRGSVPSRLDRWWRDQRARQTLEDIIGFGDQAARFVARGHDVYQDDEFAQLAGQALVERIGDASSRLSAACKEDFPEIPWSRVKDMRNVMVHHYEIINPERVWETLVSDVPALLSMLGLDDVRR